MQDINEAKAILEFFLNQHNLNESLRNAKQCLGCSAIYFNRASLRRHVLSTTEDSICRQVMPFNQQKIYVCEECKYQCTTTDAFRYRIFIKMLFFNISLDKNESVKHSKTKFKCDSCQGVYSSRKAYLNPVLYKNSQFFSKLIK